MMEKNREEKWEMVRIWRARSKFGVREDGFLLLRSSHVLVQRLL